MVLAKSAAGRAQLCWAGVIIIAGLSALLLPKLGMDVESPDIGPMWCLCESYSPVKVRNLASFRQTSMRFTLRNVPNSTSKYFIPRCGATYSLAGSVG